MSANCTELLHRSKLFNDEFQSLTSEIVEEAFFSYLASSVPSKIVGEKEDFHVFLDRDSEYGKSFKTWCSYYLQMKLESSNCS